jgi:hypothetical protein
MKITRIRGITIALILVVTALSITAKSEISIKGEKSTTMDKNHIVLLGASVGKAWRLQDYASRMKDPEHTIESIAVYQYDKTEGLEEILMRPKRKFRLTRTYLKGFFQPAPKLPGIIIIKECAAYFPGNMDTYKDLIKQWVKRIREANIEVLIATTVPITRERAKTKKGQIEQIVAFNDWMRTYAGKEHIGILDLEAALRISSVERFLRDELSTDGLHLNEKAYDILDNELKVLLQTNP